MVVDEAILGFDCSFLSRFFLSASLATKLFSMLYSPTPQRVWEKEGIGEEFRIVLDTRLTDRTLNNELLKNTFNPVAFGRVLVTL